MGRDPRSLHSQCPTLYFPCQRQRLQTRRYGDGLVGRATRGAPQARPPAGRGEGKGREARAQQSSSCAGSVRRGATGGLFSSRGPLLAPPLLQGPAHPHGHHSGVSVIELHDERVALQGREEAVTGSPRTPVLIALSRALSLDLIFPQ